MSEILTAITLLMTVAMILYGLWHKEMVNATQITPKDYDSSNKVARRYVRKLLLSQALPLVFLTAFTALIFTPELLRICGDSLAAFQRHGALALRQYSSVNTAFVMVELSVAWLTWHAGSLSWELIRKWKCLGRGKALPTARDTQRSRP